MSTLSREKAEKARLRGRAKKRVRENRARGKARGRDSDRRTEKSVEFRGGLKYETAAA